LVIGEAALERVDERARLQHSLEVGAAEDQQRQRGP
jgi:hypothetical protein